MLLGKGQRDERRPGCWAPCGREERQERYAGGSWEAKLGEDPGEWRLLQQNVNARRGTESRPGQRSGGGPCKLSVFVPISGGHIHCHTRVESRSRLGHGRQAGEERKAPDLVQRLHAACCRARVQCSRHAPRPSSPLSLSCSSMNSLVRILPLV